MVGKTQFDVKVPVVDTSSSDGMFTMAFQYYMTRDKVRWEIVSSQGYNQANLGFYALNMDEVL